METNRKVYVELLDEGTEVRRQTEAKELGDGLFELLPTPNYDPQNELWAFLPGEVVRLEEARSADGQLGLMVKHQNPGVVRINVESPNDVFALRTTNALSLGNGIYKVLPTPHYNPETENWKFPPGSVVALKEREWPSRELGTCLLAVERSE